MFRRQQLQSVWWVAMLAAVSVLLTPGNVWAQRSKAPQPQPEKPIPAIEAYQRIRAELLTQIPGLDTRNAHFFILVDVSASGVDIFRQYVDLNTSFTKGFFMKGDQVTMLGYARHPKNKAGLDLTNSADLEGMTFLFDKQVASASFPTIVQGTDWGTDADEPLYTVLKWIREKGLKEREAIVILQIGDTRTTDYGGRPASEFFPHNDSERKEFQTLKESLNVDAHGHVRMIGDIYPFLIQGVPPDRDGNWPQMYVTAWYSDNILKFPVNPDINREADNPHITLGRPDVDTEKSTVTFRWVPQDKASYVLYLSNEYDELIQALDQKHETNRARRIPLNDPKPSQVKPGQLEQTVAISDIEKEGIVDSKRPIFCSIRTLVNGQEGSLYMRPDVTSSGSDANRKPEIRVISIPPRIVRIPYTLIFGRIAIILFVLLLLIYLLSRPTYHTVERGEEVWEIRTSSRGLSVEVNGRDNLHEEDVIKVSPPAMSEEMPIRSLGVLIAHPHRFPAKLRSRLTLETAEGINASINGATTGSSNGALAAGLNDVRFVVPGENSSISIKLQVADYWKTYRRLLMTLLVVTGLLLIDLMALTGSMLAENSRRPQNQNKQIAWQVTNRLQLQQAVASLESRVVVMSAQSVLKM